MLNFENLADFLQSFLNFHRLLKSLQFGILQAFDDPGDVLTQQFPGYSTSIFLLILQLSLVFVWNLLLISLKCLIRKWSAFNVQKGLWLRHGYIPEGKEDLRVQEVVHWLLIGLIMTQKAIVEVAVLRRIYSYEIASPLVFKDGFDDYLSLLRAELKKLVEVLFLDPIDFINILYFLVDFLLNLLVEFPLTTTLLLVYQQRIVLVKEISLTRMHNADKIEGIFDQISFYFEIKRRLKCQRRR